MATPCGDAEEVQVDYTVERTKRYGRYGRYVGEEQARALLADQPVDTAGPG
jgi:hypothetical protein